MFVRIDGETHFLWRPIDHEGEILKTYVSKRRDRKAALKFPKNQCEGSGHPSYCDGQAHLLQSCDEGDRQRQGKETGRRLNNLAEN